MTFDFDKNHWALILGGSSGIGLATAQRLAQNGMNVAVVHRDRRGAMKKIEEEFSRIRDCGVGFIPLNLDALSAEGRETVLDTLAGQMGDTGRVRLLLHSIALGNLKCMAPLPGDFGSLARKTCEQLAARLGVPAAEVEQAVGELRAEPEVRDALLHCEPPGQFDPEALLNEEDFNQTVFNMGTSMATWTSAIFNRGLFAGDARVIGLTSESNRVAWRGYAAISAAKAALEAISRSMAYEYAPHGIRSNIVQAGVTDTVALRRIPGSPWLKSASRLRNPFGRLTEPADVANFICLLCTDEAAWVNGALIHVDGGEHIGA